MFVYVDVDHKGRTSIECVWGRGLEENIEMPMEDAEEDFTRGRVWTIYYVFTTSHQIWKNRRFGRITHKE
jgi:hypothetical protein